MSETWLPITLAPDDGRQFIAVRWTEDGPEFDVCQWIGFSPDHRGPWLSGFEIDWTGDDFRSVYTHWCELPDPPERP